MILKIQIHGVDQLPVSVSSQSGLVPVPERTTEWEADRQRIQEQSRTGPRPSSSEQLPGRKGT